MDNGAMADLFETKIANLSAGAEELRSRQIKFRREVLRQLRFSIVLHQEEIAAAISADTGKPIFEALNQEVTAALGMIRFFERKVPRWLKARRFRNFNPGFWAKANSVYYEPLGMIAVIGPSNYPFSLIVMQAAFAFMCGNPVALKPSEKCARTSELLRQIFSEIDGEGKYFAVFKGGGEVGESLIQDERVRKIVFTGSSDTGRKIAELAGKHFKPVILELGGSGAAIVCKDANLKLAAKGILWSALYSNADSCIGTKRVFAHSGVANQLRNILRTENDKLKSGSPENPDSDINAEQQIELIEQNSKNPPDKISAVSVVEFSSFEEAVSLANDSPFGLSASVWSGNMGSAKQITKLLDVGMVWINDTSAGVPGFPWGGTKHSGWGRMFSSESISEFTNVKAVSSERRRISTRKFWWFPYSNGKHLITAEINEIMFGKRKLATAWKALGRAFRKRR